MIDYHLENLLCGSECRCKNELFAHSKSAPAPGFHSSLEEAPNAVFDSYAVVDGPVPSLSCPDQGLHPSKPINLDFKLGSNDFPSNDIMCDKNGNTYVTVSDPTSDDRSDRPLLKFDESGAFKGEFQTSRKSLGLSEYEDPFEPSTLLPNGGIARIAWGQYGMHLVRFAPDGGLESRVKLEGSTAPTLLPYQAAAFPSGEILVSGLEKCRSRRCISAFKSFTAIYDQSGHLLKRLSIPQDDEIDAAAEIGDSRYASGPMFGNRAVAGGKMRLGDDGNVYLMRRTSPATVYVISSSGDLVRTLQVQPPRVGWASVDMQSLQRKDRD